MIHYPNGAWIDPRDVDWTDSLNGLVVPGWSLNNCPFAFKALNDDVTLALRNAKGIEPRIYVCPGPQAELLPPATTVDYDVPAEPNFHLYAVNASAEPFDDGGIVPFLVNVIDSITGVGLFSSPVLNRDLLPNGSGPSPAGNRGPYFLLDTPQLYARPSYPIVRIINNDPSTTQYCRVTLFGCVEYDL